MLFSTFGGMHSPSKSSAREEKINTNDEQKSVGMWSNEQSLHAKNLLSSTCINHQKRNRQSDTKMEGIHSNPVLVKSKESSCSVINSDPMVPIQETVHKITSENCKNHQVHENGDTQLDRCSVAKKPRDESNADEQRDINLSSCDLWKNEPTSTDGVKEYLASEGPLIDCTGDGTFENKTVVEDYRLVEN